MNIGNLREFLATLPEEFDEYELTYSEFGLLEEEEGEEQSFFRNDYQVAGVSIDADSNEVLLLSQTQDDINELMGISDGD